MSKKKNTAERVLGIAATTRAVQAVLLENGPDGPTVLRQFSRQRLLTVPDYGDAVNQPVAPKRDQAIGGGDDFTIEFGGGASSSSNLFLNSEFGPVDDDSDPTSSAGPVQSFELELGDIVDEVRDAGYGDAVLAFALSAAEAPFSDLMLPASKSGKHDRDTLLEALATQYSGAFDADRAVFLPMSEVNESESRYLAVFPKMTDAVAATLTALRGVRDAIPQAALLDAELTVLMGLARAAKDSFGSRSGQEQETGERDGIYDKEADEESPSDRDSRDETLIVRAGAEDTLVVFLSGDTIHHAEILRSLTAFDQAETICSRVLLQQDEQAHGEVQHILVLSEERENELAETLEVFFPEAQVELLRSYLPEMDEDEDQAATALVSACGVGLRILAGSPYADSFEEINFLPRRLARRKLRLPITGHMVAMSVMIVLTTLFFLTRYSTAETEMDAYRNRLETVAPGVVNQDISMLQAHIDSMEHLYATYTRAIEVLDTLLLGSDRWSRLLENTSREASNVTGFWIESLEQDGGLTRIVGNATSRDQVVMFASRVDGIIESLTFSEIREWPVYSYSMAIPVADSLPNAARYLRENVQLDDEPVVAGSEHEIADDNERVER